MRSLLALLAGVVVLGFAATTAEAQDVRVENVNFYQEGDYVIILYDLIGKPGRKYNVEVVMSTNGGRTFPFKPKALSGAVGKGVTPGQGKRVSWRFLADRSEGFEGDLAFEVRAHKQGGGGKGILLGLLGAAVVGGGAAAAVMMAGGGDGDSGGLPAPPGRPGG